MSALLDVARRLATANPKRPSQAFLRRSISTVYYALFHALAQDCADLLVGVSADTKRAWAQAYRALDHGTAKAACRQAAKLGFPAPIVLFANFFVDMQEKRHAADYDPLATFSRSDALTLVANAATAIASLRAASRVDRRAFAVLVLFRKR